MALREAVGEVTDVLRARPGLFALGTIVALVRTGVVTVGILFQTLVDLVVAGPAITTQPYDPTFVAYLGPVLGAVGLFLTRPLLVAVYVPARVPPEGVARTLRRGASAVRTHYRTLLSATVRAESVAVGSAVVAVGCWYVLSTVGRLLLYQFRGPSTPYPLETPVLSLAVFSLTLVASRYIVGFADLAVLREGTTPATAWRTSAWFARRRPRLVAGYALGSSVLASLLVVPTTVLAWPTSVVAVIALAAIATTFVATLHVSLFDRHAQFHELAVRSRRSLPVTRYGARTAVAAVVLGAAIGGAAAVRVGEVGVHDPGFEEPAPDASPAAVYDVALENTIRSSHRTVRRTYNKSQDAGRPTAVWDWQFDYRDRQAIIHFYQPRTTDETGASGGGYYDSGVLGVNVGDRGGSNWNGDWKPIPFPGWAFVVDEGPGGDASSPLPNADVPWTVVSRNASTLVLRVTAPEDIRSALAPETYAGMGDNMTDDSRLTVWVDRERVVVEQAVWDVGSRKTDLHYRYEVRTSGVGTHDVTRPQSLPPRHLLEWLWDAIYY